MSTVRFSDESLREMLPRLVKRDEAAWETFFNGLYGLVKSIVLRVHFQAEDVEDAVADAFRNVVDAIEDVAQAKSPLNYIGAITRNAAVASKRRKSRVSDNEVAWNVSESDDDDLPSLDFLAAKADRPDQGVSLISQQVDRELQELFAALSDFDHRLLRLKYANDFSYQEMAYVIGKEDGALRVALHRVVQAIRAKLSEDSRDAVASDVRIFERVGRLGLAKRESSAEVEQHRELLETYVADPESLAAGEVAKIEQLLAGSPVLREAKVLLDRQLVAEELDVVAHSALLPPMPAQMLRDLLDYSGCEPVARA